MRRITMIVCAALLGCSGGAVAAQELTPMEALGKSIFFDHTLSNNGNMACAACHAPESGWTGPLSGINAAGAVYEGSVAGRFGNRKPPTAAYATLSPILHYEMEHKEALFEGATSGTAARRARSLATRPPTRRRVPSSIPSNTRFPNRPMS